MVDKGIYFMHQILTPEGYCKHYNSLKDEFDIDGIAII